MSILHPNRAAVNPPALSHEVAWARLRSRTIAASLAYNLAWDRWTEARTSKDADAKEQARQDVDRAYLTFRAECDAAHAEYQAAHTGILVQLPCRALAEV